MKLHIQACDNPDAPTLVFSAGLGGLGSFWLPQLSALRAHYRVVTYDQTDTGENAAALPAGYSMADMARELAEALAAAGLTRVIVAGHALGGMVALQMALDYPQQVERLVIVNGWLQLDAHTRRCFQVRRDLLLNVGVAAWVRAQPLFLYPASWLAEQEARLEAEEALQIAHFQGMDNLLRRLHALMACDYRGALGQLQQPVLLICTQDDLLVPWRCSQQLQAELPHARLAIMPWGGHAMSVSDSEEFNRHLLQGLQAISPAAAAANVL